MKHALSISFACLLAMHAQSIPTNPGDPLPGLSIAELDLFRAGRNDFVNPYPAGSSAPIIERATTQTCSGCHRQSSSYPLGGVQPGSPLTPPVFGAGLIENIPDQAILALQDRPEAQALGIAGRASMVRDATGRWRVGRFGWGAQYATLLDASGASLSTYLGVPESVFLKEVPDPATGLRTIDRLAAFSRLLAPINRLPPSPAADQGAQIFNQIGCAVCHTPAITTASPGTASAATISPFSDFLLHDIGTGGSFRTAPLWGLRLRSAMLHDGSSTAILDTIRSHGGEATVVRQRFDSVSSAGREAVIEFLKTL